MAKRTYSQREKRQKTYGQQSFSAQDESRKRHKTHDADELRLPPSPPPSRGEKTSSLLKKSLKVFGGPISIPEDDMVVDAVPKSKNRLPVFDKVLNARFQPVKPKQQNIYGSREDFAETMKSGKTWKQSDPKTRNSHLPTPPAEVQKQAYQEARRAQTLPKPNNLAVNHAPKGHNVPLTPSKTPQHFDNASTNKRPKEPYKPKAYQAEKNPAPRSDLFGDRLSKNSQESKLWSANQTTSPFLRLPGEIRNAIYSYALGNNTINIGFETYRTTYASNQPCSVDPVFKYHCTVFNPGRTNPFRPTRQPHVRISSGFTLLNSVCRQLYLETAVLPYKLNLLAFGSYNVMFNFLVAEERLTRNQLDVITMVVLPDGLPGANVLGLLRNLERVFLGVGLEGRRKGWYFVERREGEEPRLVDDQYLAY